jgi:HEAT repeat protein
MDDDLQKTWERIAANDVEGIDIRGLQRKLFYVCFEAAGSTDPAERLKALRVAAHFSADDRLRLVDPMINDSDPSVRRYAFNLAVAAEAQGITALKTCVGGNDPDLAAEALGLLITQVDITSSLHARQWLNSEDPRIRAGAAMLLGHIAGPAMSVHLGRIAQRDPVYGVRILAAEAAQRCAGELPKNAPQDFWVAGPTPIELPDEPVPDAPRPATPVPAPPRRTAVALPPPPRLDSQRLPTLYPDAADRDDAPDETAAPAPPAPPAPANPIVPSTPADAPESVRDTPRDWRAPAPLPATLPTEPAALLKLMGWVAEDDRARVHHAFTTLPEAERTAALRRWTPGGDPSIGRGTALMLAALGENRSASMLRHLLTDADAGVRAGAAEAIGAIGALSMIPPLSNLLNDADPDVRVAAIRGLSALLTRTERFAMLRERVGPMTDDPHTRVKEAASQALASLA